MKIGIVGYGTGGKNFHAPFIEATAGLELAGIVARAPATIARAQADFPHVPIHASLSDMLEAGIDIVTITTPPQTRRDLVLEAIEAGVYHNRRYDADMQTLKKLLIQQRLGRVWRLHNRMDLDDPATLEGGPTGGLLRDMGSHLVDQALWLLGPVTMV